MHTKQFLGAMAGAWMFATAGAFGFGDSGSARAATPDVWLQGAGATFPALLYKRWIEAYQRVHPEVSINYEAVGSGEGVSRFLTGAVDFGASDVELSSADAGKVANGVVMVPATAGMVVLAYNLPGVSGDLKLPREVYADIFAGRINQWDDPRIVAANPGVVMPRRQIALVVRLDSSGTTATFARNLDAISDSWRKAGLGTGKLVNWPSTAMAVRGNEGVASRIKISEGAIGYLEYGFAQRLGLPVAALQNKAGQFCKPTEQAGQQALSEVATDGATGSMPTVIADPAAANAYPIVTYSWLLLYKQYADARKSAAVKDFVRWGLNDGQAFGGEFGYIPLTPTVVERGAEAVASIR